MLGQLEFEMFFLIFIICPGFVINTERFYGFPPRFTYLISFHASLVTLSRLEDLNV